MEIIRASVYVDTINVFKHRKPNSIVVWHDFKSDDFSTIYECAYGVKLALQPGEWKNVFCFDANVCGIYLPPSIQKDFSF